MVAPRCAISAVNLRLMPSILSSILSSSASILLSSFSNLLSTLSSSLSIRLSKRPMFMLNVANEYPSIAIISAVRNDWSGCSTILRHAVAVAVLVVSPAVSAMLAALTDSTNGSTDSAATGFTVAGSTSGCVAGLFSEFAEQCVASMPAGCSLGFTTGCAVAPASVLILGFVVGSVLWLSVVMVVIIVKYNGSTWKSILQHRIECSL